ncbi:hypothetical protein GCM10027186_04960 [Micromonospora schwarzwaldensis]
MTAPGTAEVTSHRLCSAPTDASRTDGDDARPIDVALLGSDILLKAVLRQWLQSKGGGSPTHPPSRQAQSVTTTSDYCG